MEKINKRQKEIYFEKVIEHEPELLVFFIYGILNLAQIFLILLFLVPIDTKITGWMIPLAVLIGICEIGNILAALWGLAYFFTRETKYREIK